MIPWILMIAVLLFVLWHKGYLRVQSPVRPGPNATTLEEMALAFARAAKIQAEHEATEATARAVAEDLKARFTAPFSEGTPAPAPAA